MGPRPPAELVCLLSSCYLFWAALLLSAGLTCDPLSASSQAETAAERNEFVEAARESWLRGRYEEAVDLVQKQLGTAPLPEDEKIEAILILSRSLAATGEHVESERVIEESLATSPRDARLLARLCELQFLRGDWENAESCVADAIKSDGECLPARWVQAQLLFEKGQVSEAEEAYRWFVKHYNKRQPKDAESLVLVGRGASEYARYKRVSQIFNFAVNTLCPDARKAESDYWPARLLAGELLLDKYNESQGVPELNAALAINPRATDVLVRLGWHAVDGHDWVQADRRAEAALAIDPLERSAIELKIAILLSGEHWEDAEPWVERLASRNSRASSSLAWRAAWELRRGRLPDPQRLQVILDHIEKLGELSLTEITPFEQLLLDAIRQSPRPGMMLTTLAGYADSQRQYQISEPLYLAALRVMPKMSRASMELGRHYLQRGENERARPILDAAFEADPYHVRVSNLRKVLKLLDGYEDIQTDHFVIRARSESDAVLAQTMADYLEEIYPELTAKFGFEPPQRTLVELYSTGDGQTGHQWFSARMVGLPWVQTIGASTGTIIAMASPSSLDQPLNWGRVLKHEFVHVITLQQTGFQIPHWFTEALATRSEGFPSPANWVRMLSERYHSKKLRTLENLSQGFIRAESQADWEFAYCQSVVYADYFEERFGAEALKQLLIRFQERTTTQQAVESAFQCSLEDLEAGYLDFVRRRVEGMANDLEVELEPREIERRFRQDRENPERAGAFAWLLWRARRAKDAVELAEATLQKSDQNPLAIAVLLARDLRDGELKAAWERLEGTREETRNHREVMYLECRLLAEEKRWDAAKSLLRNGGIRFRSESRWPLLRAQIAEKSGDLGVQREAWEQYSLLEPNVVSPRKALAQLAMNQNDWVAAGRWGREALQTDALDAENHALMAKVREQTGESIKAAKAWKLAWDLSPGDPRWGVPYAQSLMKEGNLVAADRVVTLILKGHPEHVEAISMRTKLDQQKLQTGGSE